MRRLSIFQLSFNDETTITIVGTQFLQTDIYKQIKTHEIRKNGDLLCQLNRNTTQHTNTHTITQCV